MCPGAAGRYSSGSANRRCDQTAPPGGYHGRKELALRELLELGFEVAVVRDATAAAKIPDGDGYLAAITNFRFIANAVWSTDEAIAQLGT